MKLGLKVEDTSIEFAIDIALERLLVLVGQDHKDLIDEYTDWFNLTKDEIEVLFINNDVVPESF